MSGVDDTTVQVAAVLFVMATVVLVYTARFFHGRRGRRRTQRRLAGMDQIPLWSLQSTESNRPLHLAFGGAGVGGDSTAAALAEAEFFHHVIESARASDIAPIVSLSEASSLPLAQDTLRRAWREGNAWSRAQWHPAGLAYAGAITASIAEDEPTAHILAGRFGPELALMLDSAARRGQPSLAVSERLDGGAVAYAMADHVLIGEELFAASSAASEDAGGQSDAAVLDVWRWLIILGATLALLLGFSDQLPLLSWQAALAAGAILIALGAVLHWRR